MGLFTYKMPQHAILYRRIQAKSRHIAKHRKEDLSSTSSSMESNVEFHCLPPDYEELLCLHQKGMDQRCCHLPFLLLLHSRRTVYLHYHLNSHCPYSAPHWAPSVSSLPSGSFVHIPAHRLHHVNPGLRNNKEYILEIDLKSKWHSQGEFELQGGSDIVIVVEVLLLGISLIFRLLDRSPWWRTAIIICVTKYVASV